MSGAIINLPEGGKPVELHPQRYDSEEALQKLLSEHPNLLAGDQMDPDSPRRWLLISREMSVAEEPGGISRWSLDHLFLDQEGVPTLVEVKRGSDTRLRREVVGQMLDYAANGLVSWPVEKIRSTLEQRCAEAGDAPAVVLSQFLDDNVEEQEFWNRVETNLQAGRLRLVFVADEIPGDLLRVIQFLDRQMSLSSVHAVEIRQYVGEGMRTLVPRVVGLSGTKITNRSMSEPWTEDRFFDALGRAIPKLAAVARQLFIWGQELPRYIRWGSGGSIGSFHVHVDSPEGFRHTLFTVATNGKIRIQFRRLSLDGPFALEETRIEFRDRLTSIPGLILAGEGVAGKPAFPMSTLKDEAKLKQFLSVIEWAERIIRSR